MDFSNGDFVKTTELVRAVVEGSFGKLDVSGLASVVSACVPLFGSYVDGEWVPKHRFGTDLCGGGVSRDVGRWVGPRCGAAFGHGVWVGTGSCPFEQTGEVRSERAVSGNVGDKGLGRDHVVEEVEVTTEREVCGVEVNEEENQFASRDAQSVRGKNWKKNQRKAENRKVKKKEERSIPEWRRKGVGEKSELQKSLEAKWQAENALKVAKAQRELELLKKQDVDAIAKCHARKLQAASEKAMVQMEKAHATLVATGNVPGEVALGGTAHTVVDGEIVSEAPGLTNSCSISPNSSISEREVREMMKALEDEKKKNAELEEKMKFMKLDHKLERFGDQCAVTMTCDSEGELPEGREELLEQIVRANNGREEDRVYKKDYFKKKIVNVKVQQYRQLGMDEYVGAFDY